MMKPTTIEIAIPTFNRKTYCLHQLAAIRDLRSYASRRFTFEIRVRLYDNSSNDSNQFSEDELAAFDAECIRRPKNLGLIGNYTSIIDECSSPFLWILGDDDKLLDRSFGEIGTALETMLHTNFPIFLNHAYEYQVAEHQLQFTQPTTLVESRHQMFSMRDNMKISACAASTNAFQTALVAWDQMDLPRDNLALPLFIAVSLYLSAQRLISVTVPTFFCPKGNSSWSSLANKLFVVDTPQAIHALAVQGLRKDVADQMYLDTFSLYRTKPLKMFFLQLLKGSFPTYFLRPYANPVFYRAVARYFLKAVYARFKSS